MAGSRRRPFRDGGSGIGLASMVASVVVPGTMPQAGGPVIVPLQHGGATFRQLTMFEI